MSINWRTALVFLIGPALFLVYCLDYLFTGCVGDGYNFERHCGEAAIGPMYGAAVVLCFVVPLFVFAFRGKQMNKEEENRDHEES